MTNQAGIVCVLEDDPRKPDLFHQRYRASLPLQPGHQSHAAPVEIIGRQTRHNRVSRGLVSCRVVWATNPHILNIAPPLNLLAGWFTPHVAYTMSKYGMSLCLLGMADEFRRYGVAVNALWPRMAIAAAVRNLLGGDSGGTMFLRTFPT